MTHDELCGILNSRKPRCTGKPAIAGFYLVPRASCVNAKRAWRKSRCVPVQIWRCPACGQHIHAYETAEPVSFN